MLHRTALDTFARTLPDGDYDVIIQPHKRTRSLDQNRWTWGVAYPLIADALGYERHELDAIHYALVAKCFGTHVDDRLGVEVPNQRSSKLTTQQYSHYMEWLVRIAAQEWGVQIPLPDESAVAA